MAGVALSRGWASHLALADSDLLLEGCVLVQSGSARSVTVAVRLVPLLAQSTLDRQFILEAHDLLRAGDRHLVARARR